MDNSKVSIKKDIKKREDKVIPKDAEIVSKRTTTDVEEIENGYLITKETETTYKKKGSEYSDWHNETKKWYSKEDPLEITVGDKSLADAFGDD